jgi:transposase
MRRFVEGADRGQSTLFPDRLEDWIGEDNPVRVIDVFVDELDLAELGFSGVDPGATGRPSYHPSVLLKLYIYGYLNRVQSSRRKRNNVFAAQEFQDLKRKLRKVWRPQVIS